MDIMLLAFMAYLAIGALISLSPIREHLRAPTTVLERVRYLIGWALLWPVGLAEIRRAGLQDAEHRPKIEDLNRAFDEKLARFRAEYGPFDWRPEPMSPAICEAIGHEIMLKERLPESTRLVTELAGEEIWTFTTHPESWFLHAGRSGEVLVRNGEVVRVSIVLMN